MTWILSTGITVLLRLAAPLIRRGLPYLAVAAMALLVCGTGLAAGQGLLHVARWLPTDGWPLATVLIGLLGAVVRLAAWMGLAALVVLMPLVVTADCLTTRPAAPDEHTTGTPPGLGRTGH